jgi:hypothetical protein
MASAQEDAELTTKLALEHGVSEDAVRAVSMPCAAVAEPWRSSAMPTSAECRSGLPA